ncbi:MAG: amino acid permease [Acidobacteria bacterium]|nr:MAG: amino acid permease [Acidobacteriota bacterium]
MIDMVGIGPFVTISLVIQYMGGPQCLLAWVAGALLSVLDGFVWSELGAAMPQAGGSYVFLREAYGPGRWGRLMSFLFIWQTMIQAPLVVASGAIGFAQYLTYLMPLGRYQQKAVSGALVIVLVFLLYRRITTVGKISLFLWAGVIATIVWLIFGGATHFDARLAFTYPAGAWDLSWLFFVGLGQATVKTIYTYLGYYNVCHLGGEVREPERNIPRSIFLSIGGIAVLYLAMQTSILGVVPWQQAQASNFIVSTFIEMLYGPFWAKVATGMILWIAFASLFSVLLGYSRVPYAAAVDGNFFSVFGQLHPTLGAAGFVFSLLFRLSEVISAVLAMRILVQFVGQAIGVIVLRRRWPAERLPFKMWLFPLPAVLAILGWMAIFLSTGRKLTLAALGVMMLGVLAFGIRARALGEWPFAETAG